MSDVGEVTLERHGRIGVITISRPGKRNALSQTMWASLRSALAELAAQPPRVVVISGAGDAFCAGMDVSIDNPHVADLVTAAQTHDKAPMKRLLMELGGKGALVMTEDCDVQAAVGGIASVWGFHSGQICTAPTRVICHRDVYDDTHPRAEAS